MTKKSTPAPRKSFLKKQIPLSYLIIAVLIASTAFVWKWDIRSSSARASQASGVSGEKQSEVHIIRAKGNGYTRPLILVDFEGESKSLQTEKNELESFIRQKKQDRDIMDASVYLRILNNDSWISINPNARYDPGSMLKVVMMLNYLKHAEEDPGLLDKMLLAEKVDISLGESTHPDLTIEAGRKYKVSELLYQMIARSDNLALFTLDSHLPTRETNYLFQEVGINLPGGEVFDVKLTASEYSRFLRALYDCNLVNRHYSEYGLSILAGSTYNQGITKYLPGNIKVAHKFGEINNGNFRELSESAIVYIGDNTYLLTVMTKGKEFPKLAEVIAEISKLVYSRLSVPS